MLVQKPHEIQENGLDVANLWIHPWSILTQYQKIRKKDQEGEEQVKSTKSASKPFAEEMVATTTPMVTKYVTKGQEGRPEGPPFSAA